MFEPNSVASAHLVQEHQKFLVIARWSRLVESETIEMMLKGYSIKVEESEFFYFAFIICFSTLY